MGKRATKLKRWVWVFDTHGDMIDPDAEAAFKQFVGDFKPDFRGHGGDFVDLRGWRRGASAEDRAESMKDDVERAREFLWWYKPDAVTLGNHDHRMVMVGESATDPVHRMAATQCYEQMIDAMGEAEVVPYGKRNFYQHANYRVIHGYASGVYAARKHAQSYCGNVLAGHIHAFSCHTELNIDRTRSHTSGSLCRTDMGYNASHLATLRQENGWLYGFEVGGELVVYEARKVGGHWLFPTEMGGAA